MDHLLPDDIDDAKPTATGEAPPHDLTSPDAFDIKSLPKCEESARNSTAADVFDIEAASKAAEDIDISMTSDLTKELIGCRKDFRTAASQKTTSLKSHYGALARSHRVGMAALQSRGALVALAKEREIPTTKASWKNPMLVVLKLIDPKMDDKSASMCARALNYISAAEVPPDKVADFLAEHGVVALAREEAKRQKLRKGGGSEKPPAMDPLEALRQERTPVPLSTERDLEGFPEKDGEMGLMLIGHQNGQAVAWAVDADEKAIAATIRRILKQRAGGDSG